ncbi:unnamed protein product [Notodromas monacha]|uniref:Uncharacterized protein n=1 Tax=Notodromas monacha TaxID=399045 RepID=A0A7R9BJD6_9CRUS|nr:unnamed protein product [Notodromas monacha]CAG0915201.1 unnamed protein product [Notodromas monacha]
MVAAYASDHGSEFFFGETVADGSERDGAEAPGPFRCPICDVVTGSQEELESHFVLVHDDQHMQEKSCGKPKQVFLSFDSGGPGSMSGGVTGEHDGVEARLVEIIKQRPEIF